MFGVAGASILAVNGALSAACYGAARDATGAYTGGVLTFTAAAFVVAAAIALILRNRSSSPPPQR
ncbi:MAG: hypothetical protein AB7L13_24805 [Acidimicrobiia bacterium]